MRFAPNANLAARQAAMRRRAARPIPFARQLRPWATVAKPRPWSWERWLGQHPDLQIDKAERDLAQVYAAALHPKELYSRRLRQVSR